MMRRATGRPIVLGFLGGYHGESTRPPRSAPRSTRSAPAARPRRPGSCTRPIRTPIARRSARRAPAAAATRPSTTSATSCSSTRRPGARWPACVIEPVLGSGGCVAPPDAFWAALTALCDEHDWLLCADEVKTGIGRSGTHVRGRALGRAAGSDVPRQGAGRRRDADRRGARLRARRSASFDDVPTGSTWSWLPGAVAAALATLDAYEREDVLGERAALEARRRRAARRPGRAPPADRRGPRGRRASRRSSSSATARPSERDTDLQDAVAGPRRCGAASSPTRARPRSTSSRRC